MAAWSEYVPTSGGIELPPDPRVMEAMGRNHSLETALADLVDNSIDAAATHIVIQFIRSGGKLRSLYVVDNGRGMGADQIDAAMRMGGDRSYGAEDLGHFGLGLKAATFSQASSLTVMSRRAGHAAVGRRWQLEKAVRSYHCDEVPEQFASETVDADWGLPPTGTGTVVRWDDVSGFPNTADPDRVETFISHTINAAYQHLGLVFHRFLEQERVHIAIEVRDAETDEVGSRLDVTPLNPFGYPASARIDYPKVVKSADQPGISFRCHIWPPRSNRPEFKLPVGADRSQGWYFYRRDRLLVAGAGWEGLGVPPKPRLQLARVEIEINDEIAGLFRMNPEKSKVLISPEFSEICENARADDGTSLSGYLDVAEDVFRTSKKRSSERRRMIHPGSGFPRGLKNAIKSEIPALNNHDAIDIRWRQFTDDTFFEVDRENNTLWLNKRYRKMLLGGKHGGLNDLPLIKTLLYLLMENVFEGQFLGARDKDNVDLWQELLTIAVRAERQ
jgi:hypothetical protein